MEHLLSRRSRQQQASQIRELLRLVEQPGMLSLAGGLPAADRFPEPLLADAFAAALRRLGPTGPVALQYAPTEGVLPLRQHLADELGTAIDSVLVTTGSQQALDLLARVLCDPGDVILVEEPTYLGALQAFRFADVDVRGVPGDDDGLDVEALEDRLRAGVRPKAVYVCPNFANPTGTTLSAPRRQRLVELAGRYGFLVIEDDPYGALRFAGEAPRSMAAPGRPVVRLGSASKVIAPGLRVGWMTGPAPVVAAAVRAKQAADLHTSSLNQLLVLGALADPRLTAHLAGTTAAYASRAAALTSGLRDAFGDGIEFAEPCGGMFVWARLPGIDTDALLAAALDERVAFVPGSAFAVAARDAEGRRPHRDRLRLSFATLDPDGLVEAVARLRSAVRRSSTLAR